MKNNIKGTALAAGIMIMASVAIYTTGAGAHGGATGVVKERMDLMSAIGKAQKSLAEMFSGKKPYQVEKVRAAAKEIEKHGGTEISKLFPKGSIKHPSEALPKIWKSWGEFKQLTQEVSVFAKALGENAGNDKMMAVKKGKAGMMGTAGMGKSTMMGGGKPDIAGQLAALKTMPPLASFQRLAATCNACHTKFRLKKK